jgi:hypothetical protein
MNGEDEGMAYCSRAPDSRFPVELSGFHEVHAPFLKERQHTQSRPVQRAGNSGHLARFREMWDITNLNLLR